MVLNGMQRQVGTDNYDDAVRYSRRQFILGAAAAPVAATAAYWGYESLKGDPVRVGVIGTGNQGIAHISHMNPEYVQVVAFSDIRPSNQQRAWDELRRKFPKTHQQVQLHEDYNDLLKDDRVEMVIIALPLILHAPATIAAVKAGKHVLCEKLMAKTVGECKDMVHAAEKAQRYLAIGHQRHYSYLYANCLSIIQQSDVLGDIRYIDAWWHRNQTRGGREGAEDGRFDGWKPSIPDADKGIDCHKYGYDSVQQLVQWRLSNKTGGGLIVELGSHQLDAASIFLGKVHPVAVVGVGVKSFFTDDREIDDHIFLTYEYPKGVVVTYSSISTNAFDQYGEKVLGTRGTMIVESEANAYVFDERGSKESRIGWAEARVSRPVMESGSTTQWVSTATGAPDTLTSRGYREEQEHLAWLIRNGDPRDPALQPRCNGRVALADAVVALCSNMAMHNKTRIEYRPEWFDADRPEAPEDEYKSA